MTLPTLRVISVSQEKSNLDGAFNPQRLRIARDRRGLTKEALGTECGVTRRAVTDWELGNVESPPVARISAALNFPANFFFGEDLDEVSAEAASFRAYTSMSQRQLHRVLAQASLIRRFSDWIDARYDTPETDIPSIQELTPPQSEDEPIPTEAAASLRAMWSLGARPIKNMLALLESQGVRVFALGASDREIDAFSFWYAKRAYVFLNTNKSAERLRFDLAHELGHLCMHAGLTTNRIRRYELDANAFASSFLMPRTGLVPQIVTTPRFDDLMVLKRHWGVSATAMARRLHQLGRILDWQYRSWMVDLSQAGFRTAEPGGGAREQSTILRQVLALAREDGWNLLRISEDLGIPVADLSDALMGLAVIQLPMSELGSFQSSRLDRHQYN
jgi:Zn-dependent peptidase ImmA (M78 family)/DNA-binding XRE family transcriptional regulator